MLPEHVTDVNFPAFLGCSNLAILVPGDTVPAGLANSVYVCLNASYYAEDENGARYCVKNDGTAVLLKANFNDQTVVVDDFNGIPVSEIFPYAFAEDRNLKKVVIGKHVLQEIIFNATRLQDFKSYNEVFSNAGQKADGITVNIGSGVTVVPAWLFTPSYSSADGGYIYRTAPNIVEVVFKENSVCEKVASSAFRGLQKLTRIVIPDSVTELGYNAFMDCTALTSVVIPESVTSLENAFTGCNGLVTAGPIGGGYNIEFGWTDVIPASAFSDYTALESVVIPEGVTKLSDFVFISCPALNKISLPKSVVDFGSKVFDRCDNLKTAGPTGGGYNYEFAWTENIPADAFSHCSNLVEVTIPDTVTTIGEWAFYGCKALQQVDLPKALTSIRDRG